MMQELPTKYCRSRFTSKEGRPLVEFNMKYFDDTFRDTAQRMKILNLFPKEFKKGYILYKQGKLVPDSVTNKMVKDYLENLTDKKNGYLLDGYPRTIDQAKAFEEMTKGTDLAVDTVLVMDVPFEELTRRITGRRSCPKCGEIYNIYSNPPKVEGVCDHDGTALTQRKDDNEESLKTRLDEYSKNTEPVIGYYDEKGLVSHVDAWGDKDEVWTRIKKGWNI